MFCAKLRRRASFASIIQTLTSSDGLNLRENLLETHDLEIPLPSSSPASNAPNRRLRIILLSPSSCTTIILPETLSRIERLSNRTGGRDIAIVFLLSRPQTGFTSARALASASSSHATSDNAHASPTAASEGLSALSKLQAELLLHSTLSAVPLLPLPSLQSLAPLAQQYAAALVRPTPQPENAQVKALDLLAQCTVKPPLTRQTAYVVTDLVPSFRALVRCAMLDEGDGDAGREDVGKEVELGIQEAERDVVREQMANLRDFLGDEVVEGMMAFWREEWLAE